MSGEGEGEGEGEGQGMLAHVGRDEGALEELRVGLLVRVRARAKIRG